MPADSLKEIMLEPFKQTNKNFFFLISPFTITIHINFRNGSLAELKKKGLKRLALNMVMTTFNVGVHPGILDDLKRFGEFFEGFSLI